MDIEEAKKLVNKLNWSHFDMSEEASDEYVDAVQTVLSELEKKDKVINLMIEEGSHIPENELYKVEKIYREVKDKTELKGRNLKLYCIKEYFTNKVEREGK